jgi:hypothetical protein
LFRREFDAAEVRLKLKVVRSIAVSN